MTPHLEARGLTLQRGGKTLIDQLDLTIACGSYTAIIGPNGAGKTTRIKLLCGDYHPQHGAITYDDKPLAAYSPLSLARKRAVLPQSQELPFALSVAEVVALGREPWHGSAAARHDRAAARHDRAVIRHCLQTLTIDHLADHTWQTLSGGEQHRSHIARTLAQIHEQPAGDLSGKTLYLDEPTNHLDIRHQYQLMHELQRLKARGLTIIAVMHDLDLALQNADHIILLAEGKKLGDHTPQSLSASGDLERAYHIPIRHYRLPDSDRILFAPDPEYQP